MPISNGEKAFHAINTILLFLVALVCLAPMVHVSVVSLSDHPQVVAGNVIFWPKDATFSAYQALLRDKTFWPSSWISVKRVVVSLALTLALTTTAAYPLSKSADRLPGRTVLAWLFFLTMIVNGGMIPNYMVVRGLGLLGNFWALVLPDAGNAFYVLVMLNFFRRLPQDIEEAAMLDGAGPWIILFRVILPISTPAVATIAIFCSLAHWNEWFTGIIYMKAPSQYPLMSYLQGFRAGTEKVQAAQLMVAAFPMLCLYPFLQKHFVKGLAFGR